MARPSRAELMLTLVSDLASLGTPAPAPLLRLALLCASYTEARREGDRAWNRALKTLTAAGQITDDVLADLVMVRQARSPELTDAVRQAVAVLTREADENVTAEHIDAVRDALQEQRGPVVDRVRATLESLGWAGTGLAATPNQTEPRKAVQ